MDKWQITLRVEELRREILQIREANRDYKAHTTHSMSEIAKHEERQRRLKEIMVELNVLSGHPAG
ncbi:MAG: hypothetical protein ACRD3Q_09000 [Terriglobales bacterium]